MAARRSSGDAKGADRSSLDILVQNAVVQVFQTYGVAAAPIPRVDGASLSCGASDLAGTIAFSCGANQGQMILCVPFAVLAAMKSDLTDQWRALDWIRELTNQVLGRIKNRLLRFQVNLRLGMPTAARAEHLPGISGRVQSSSPPAVYRFRSMRGDIAVALHEILDESRLVYSVVDLASEGDILLF